MSYNDFYFSINAEFNKKFYISFGNVLRAAKLMRVDFYLGHGCHYCTFNVAGLGVVTEESEGDSTRLKIKHLKAYASIEDFRNNKEMSVLNGHGIKFYSRDILSSAFGEIATILGCGPYEVVRYKWNGTKAVKVEFGNYSKVWLEEDGFHTDAEIPTNTFRTKEECEKANQISVIEFDEEDE